jgi:hypothetical protein
LARRSYSRRDRWSSRHARRTVAPHSPQKPIPKICKTNSRFNGTLIAPFSLCGISRALAKCNARFEIFFADLDEVLGDTNTLIDIQMGLLDAVQDGYQYMSWNETIIKRDE